MNELLRFHPCVYCFYCKYYIVKTNSVKEYKVFIKKINIPFTALCFWKNKKLLEKYKNLFYKNIMLRDDIEECNIIDVFFQLTLF